MYLKEGLDLIEKFQDIAESWAVVKTVMNLTFRKRRKFLDQLSDIQILREKSAPYKGYP
jgi:hypothetical protein